MVCYLGEFKGGGGGPNFGEICERGQVMVGRIWSSDGTSSVYATGPKAREAAEEFFFKMKKKDETDLDDDKRRRNDMKEGKTFYS